MAKPTKLSKTAKTERQRLIEDTLKKQKSSEKRRGNAIVGVAVLIAVIIIAIPVVPVVIGRFQESAYADTPVDEIGAAPAACQEVVEKDATGVSDHVQQPTEVTYDAAPPAYGPHWDVPAGFEEKYYGDNDRPAVEELVHNLEHGYTILWYDETIADDSGQLAQVKAIARKFKESGDNQNFRNKFIAAPWEDGDADGDTKFPDGQHVAFTHWKGDSEASTGVWQYCSEVSGEALTAFMDKYPYTDSPEAVVP